MILGIDDISDLNALHSRKHEHDLQLYAFDVLAMGGDDLRQMPLHLRKTNLGAAAGSPSGRDHRRAIRAPRDRAEAFQGRLPLGARRAGLETL